MSVENFCNKYPANADIREIVANIATTKGQYDKSLVVILAEQLAREGQDGARELINKLNLSNTMLRLDREGFQNVSENDRKNLFTNFAAFVFGNSVLSLERILVDREYDHEDFCERYNLAANSLQVDKAQVGTEKREKLPSEQLAKMYSLIKEDPTFAIFFEEKGVQALPNSLRQFIESRGILPVIREAILPIYKPPAKSLVA